MTTVNGQRTFVVTEKATSKEERLTAYSDDFDVDATRTDTEDDKCREDVYLTFAGSAFDGDANFTARLYYDVFGWNVFRHWTSIEDVTEGYTVVVASDEPDDGLTVEASTLDLNQL